MSGVLAPSPLFQSFTANGLPNSFGTLATYAAGTSTPIATYVDATLTTPNENPITLNPLGQAAVWLTPGLGYKFVWFDQFGNQIGSCDQVYGALTQAALTTILTQAYLGAILYPQTAAEIAAGITPTSLQYPPYNAFRYMTAAQISAIQSYNSSTFAAANTASLQQLFNVCEANNYLATLPAGQYAINASITWSGGGGIYMEGCGFAEGGVNSEILVTGTGYTALTVQGVIPRLEIAVSGTGNACNGVVLGVSSSAGGLAESVIQYLRVWDLAGFGVQGNDWFDVTAINISVQECGTSTVPAFSLNNVVAGSSSSIITRLQVEQSNGVAIFIDNVLNCAFPLIHSERTVGVGGTAPSHTLNGDTCVYGAVRIEQTSNVLMQIGASNCEFAALRCSGTNLQIIDPYVGRNVIKHLVCNNLNIEASSTAIFDFYDASVSGTLTYNNQSVGNVRFTNSAIAAVAPTSSATSYALFIDCTITGAWTNTGNTTVDCRGCTITNFPTAQKIYLENCTVAGALNTAFNQIVYAWRSTFNGVLTFTAGDNSVFVAKNGCVFNANLVGATGNNYGVLDGTCTVAQGVTVGTDWYGAPSGLPAVLGQWAQGTQRWNPLPSASGSIAMICTTGSTSGAGTWTGFTLP
jgi:hypothetical protein